MKTSDCTVEDVMLSFRSICRQGLVWLAIAATFGAATFNCAAGGGDDQRGVRVVPNLSQGRVDVLVDGKLFTAYIFPNSLKKPVLFPLNTAQGTPVTRGFPLEPRPGERVDHPHHAGLWFNYGDVNGVDFWNNAVTLKPEQQAKMGTIIHKEVKRTSGGKDQGELEVVMEWIMPGDKTILREETKFVFHAGPNLRGVDRITKLTALGERVLFKDNKEGTIGMRVARQLEQPSNEPLVFTDAAGKPTAVAKLDNTGVTGLYRSSEGKTGDDVWGTRGRWVTLSGKIGQEAVTVAMFDHPNNPGYPTYWHARGYGLFAANPLGQKALSNGKDELNFSLEPGRSATFRHRILIISGETKTDGIEDYYRKFVSDVKP
jgi:hypothetical protein